MTIPNWTISCPDFKAEQVTLLLYNCLKKTISCYSQLIKEFNSRFCVVETQKTFAAKFSQRVQRPDETVEGYAAELKRLYFLKAYKTDQN